MKVNGTDLEVGTKVRICNITDEIDTFLNGQTGTLTHKFVCYEFGDVGVRLDNPLGITKVDTCNVCIGEFVTI